jgi:hypothetical protein
MRFLFWPKRSTVRRLSRLQARAEAEEQPHLADVFDEATERYCEAPGSGGPEIKLGAPVSGGDGTTPKKRAALIHFITTGKVG